MSMKRLGRWLKSRTGGTGAFSAGKAHLERHDYETAVMAFSDAEEAFTRDFGPQHKWVEQAIAYQAWCKVKAGSPAAGVALYERALRLAIELNDDGDRLNQLQEQLTWAKSEVERRKQDPT